MNRVRRCAVCMLVPLGLFLPGCGGGDDEPAAQAPAPTTTSSGPTTSGSPAATTSTTRAATTTTVAGQLVSVTVRGGQVQGPSRQRVERNETVTVRVSSDVADEVHVHGYDKSVPVAAGGTGEVSFVANIPGVFEVEFEKSGKLLFTREVRS